MFLRTGAILRVGGDGGDQRRQTAHAAVVAMDQLGVEAQRREAAALNAPRPEIGFGMGAVDGAAALPETAGRRGAVIIFGDRGGWHRRRGEEGVRLGEGGAERARA